MNWMTSGRQRALRSTRGKRRGEMRFPAHVQREVARARREPRAATAEEEEKDDDRARRNGGAAWYIRPVMDSHQSHDVQMLELAREAAMGVTKETAEWKTRSTTKEPTQVRDGSESLAAMKEPARPAAGERRCVFTPVKASRQRRPVVGQAIVCGLKRKASPPQRDLVLFNEGTELSKPESPEIGRGSLVHEVQQQARTISLTGRPTRDQDTSRFYEPMRVVPSHERERPARSSPAFYDASSPSSEEDGDFMDRGSGFQRSQCPGAMDKEKDVIGLHRRQDPRKARVGLFESIEREMEHNRQAVVQTITVSAHRELGRVHAATHQSVAPVRAPRLSTGCMVLEPLQPPAGSRRLGVNSDDVATSKDQLGASFRLEDPSQSVVSPTGAQGLHSSASPRSTSSQGSLVLPPPVDWHKRLIALAAEEDDTHTHFSHVDAADHLGGIDHGGDGIGACSGWSASSRTREIFRSLATMPESPSEAPDIAEDEVTTLQQQLRQHEEAAVYLFTLVQCHKINVECDEISGSR